MGPLRGIRIIEIVGLGPGPFAGMMLADMGAEVIAIQRPGKGELSFPVDLNRRGKRLVTLDLKSPVGRDSALRLCEKADGLIEGFRPGVMEKLGLCPEVCRARNPRLVYGRMTGWGQTGPLAQSAGHDINYIALSGALHAMGPADQPPVPPLNLVGDYGGGAMLLAFGLVCGILEARQSGQGQDIDASMLEGASLLMTFFHSLRASGMWGETRGRNWLDGGAPFYGTYTTRDGRFVALGAIERAFLEVFVDKAGLNPSWLDRQWDEASWPALRRELQALFATRDLSDWQALLEGTDACFAPAPPFWEAHLHPHNRARGSFVEVDGVTQPGPVPRFSRTKPEIRHGPQSTKDTMSDIDWTL